MTYLEAVGIDLEVCLPLIRKYPVCGLLLIRASDKRGLPACALSGKADTRCIWYSNVLLHMYMDISVPLKHVQTSKNMFLILYLNYMYTCRSLRV